MMHSPSRAAATCRPTASAVSLGDLPSGIQVLEVRRIGHLLAQQPVELRRGRTAEDVRLQRIVTLDSVRVLARRSRYREFEEHRRASGLGTFLTEEDVSRRRPFESSDMFRIDGMPYQDINLIHPDSSGAMEVHRAGRPAPVQYDARCGVIVVGSRPG